MIQVSSYAQRSQPDPDARQADAVAQQFQRAQNDARHRMAQAAQLRVGVEPLPADDAEADGGAAQQHAQARDQPEPPAPQAYHAVGRRFGSRLSPDEVRRRFRAAFQREELRDRAAGLQTSEAREEERWRGVVAEVLDDVTDPAACFAELFEHFS